MRWICLLALIAMTHSQPLAAAPNSSSLIAATVGDEAISQYDVDSRVRFIIATTNLANTPEVIERIRPQVIRALIDERLQLQEAKRSDIIVADADIGPAIAAIEESRAMEKGSIFKRLDEQNVPRETFAEQIRAQIAWSKLMAKHARPRVKISDEEIRMAEGRFQMSPTPEELQITVLVLPVDNPKREKEMRALSEKLATELRSGADFQEVARQFSASTLAPFWIRPAQLDPNLARLLMATKVGAVTQPVRTEQGFTVVKLLDVRMQDASADEAKAPLSDEQRARIRNMLFQQKMELEAQRYLRSLRRNAFIEIR